MPGARGEGGGVLDQPPSSVRTPRRSRATIDQEKRKEITAAQLEMDREKKREHHTQLRDFSTQKFERMHTQHPFVEPALRTIVSILYFYRLISLWISLSTSTNTDIISISVLNIGVNIDIVVDINININLDTNIRHAVL